MNKPFRVTVELASPVMISSDTNWTLDAVCFGILDEMRALGTFAGNPLDAIPIIAIDRLFLASSATFSSALEDRHIKTGAIRTVRDLADAPQFIEPGRNSRISKVQITRGQFKGHLSRYRQISAETVSWTASGDPDRTAALLDNARQIGALRKDGYGVIAAVSVETDPAIDPLSFNGRPLRPIPVDHPCAADIDPATPQAEDTWRPPYWSAENRARCYLPDRQTFN